jgi:hypothetical protein
MGALANPQPQQYRKSTSPRKTPGTAQSAVERCQPRGWKELHQASSAGTDYDRGTGWFPFPHDACAQLQRLSSGNLCTWLVLNVLQNLGRQWSGRGALPEESQALLIEELAILNRCTVHAVNEVLAYLIARRMAKVSRIAGRRIVIRLLFRDWAEIEDDYPTWARKQVKELPVEDEQEEEAEALPAVKEGRVELTRTPQRIHAGSRFCRPVKVGVRDLEVAVMPQSPVDIEISAAVVSGRLVLECIGHEISARDVVSLRNKISARDRKFDAKPVESTSYRVSPGSVDPENCNIPANGGNDKPANGGSPKRGEELAKLFDPLLLKSCGRTLSGDTKYFVLACEAIGQVPHDELVKAAIERANRPLKPHQIPAICKQISHDWQEMQKIEREKAQAEAAKKPRRVIENWLEYGNQVYDELEKKAGKNGKR